MAKYTKAKIFNITLKNLGVSVGVQSETPTDRNTAVLEEYYDTAREKTLCDHDWGFASVLRELTPSISKIRHPKYAYIYDYPNDCIFLREVFLKNKIFEEEEEKTEKISFFNMSSVHYPNKCDEYTKKQQYEVSSDEDGNKVIFTNASPAVARYTRLVDNETFYTPDFVMALSWYLAFLCSSAITGARTKSSDCLQVYAQMLREAKTADANEMFKEDEYECEWIEARG